MNTRTTKFLQKTVLLLPLGIGLHLFVTGFESFNWTIAIIMGLAFALGIVFWNVFDYEKFDDISLADYLESNHSIELENNDENWKALANILKNHFLNLKILELKGNKISAEIEWKLINSKIAVKRESNVITLQIRRKLLNIPDNAVNYDILQKITKQMALRAEALSSNKIQEA